MKILIAIAPDNFRDEELAEPRAALDKAEIGYDIASTRRGLCTGMLGAKVTATHSFEEIDPKKYDGLLVVGGSGAQAHLWEDEILVEMAKFFRESSKVVAAICLAPVVFANAGILKGRNATYFNTSKSFFEMKKGGAVLVDKPVVNDDRIITANGPAAAKEFADTFVKVVTAVEW